MADIKAGRVEPMRLSDQFLEGISKKLDRDRSLDVAGSVVPMLREVADDDSDRYTRRIISLCGHAIHEIIELRCVCVCLMGGLERHWITTSDGKPVVDHACTLIGERAANEWKASYKPA